MHAGLFVGFGGSFISPTPAPIAPAQNNLIQTGFDAAFGASQSAPSPTPTPAAAAPAPSATGSSFDASGNFCRCKIFRATIFLFFFKPFSFI